MKIGKKALLIVLVVAVLVVTGIANRLQTTRSQKTLAPFQPFLNCLEQRCTFVGGEKGFECTNYAGCVCFPDSVKPQLAKETLMEFCGASSSTPISIVVDYPSASPSPTVSDQVLSWSEAAKLIDGCKVKEIKDFHSGLYLNSDTGEIRVSNDPGISELVRTARAASAKCGFKVDYGVE